LERVDELRGWAGSLPLIEVGVAAYSVRTVPQEWLEGLGEYAANSGLPLHIHAGEQPREIEECKQEHGLRPVELLAETGFLGSGTTIVHATHADAVELDLIASSESSICVCPTTEGNLGDGFLPAEGVLERRIRLSVGSDQHVRLDPFEELRELETNARRLAGRRNVLVASKENSPTPYLLRAGQQRKGLEPGALADFIEIDLSHPEILDVEPEYLPSALIFGAGREVVAASWVAGARAYGRDHE
jgi:formimidoylglutamate deiminase